MSGFVAKGISAYSMAETTVSFKRSAATWDGNDPTYAAALEIYERVISIRLICENMIHVAITDAEVKNMYSDSD